MKYAEHKLSCICVDVYKNCDGYDYDQIHEALSRIKNKNLKTKTTLIEKYRDLLDFPDFEKDYYSRAAVSN